MYANISDTPFDQGSLVHREVGFLREDVPKKLLEKKRKKFAAIMGKRTFIQNRQKMDRHTVRQTHTQTDKLTYRKTRPRGVSLRKTKIIRGYPSCFT